MNLIDNWDFRGAHPDPLLSAVVNQRGRNVYDGSSGYCLDRYWRSVNNHVFVHDGFITVVRSQAAAAFRQYIENGALLVGKQVTLSVVHRGLNTDGLHLNLVGLGMKQYPPSSDWLLTEITGVIGEGAIWQDRHLRVDLNHSISGIGVDGASIDIMAWKLELGPVSTLANDPPMDFGTELAKCQRFFQRIHICNRISGISTNDVWVNVPLVIPMRIVPSITSATTEIQVRTGTSTTIGRTDFTWQISTRSNNQIMLRAVRANHGLTDANVTGSMDLDANL